jgi:hypothetical protein
MTKLGKYELIREIKSGSMGVVYLARDVVLDREVALKTILPGSAVDPEIRERFYREARACARLAHPAIVTVYDFGEENGTAYLAMELLQGTDLRRILAERRDIPVDKRVEMMANVCEGLDHAHQQGIVHRDIKPSNILITDDGRAKIVDFGIARLASSSLTIAGRVLGTPNYMAPEQILGKPCDARSDLFSVAIVTFEFLAWRHPFQGDSIPKRIVRETADLLTAADPSLPPALAQAMARALDRDPNNRHPSAAHLAREMREAMGGLRPVTVSTPASPPAPAAREPETARIEPLPAPVAQPEAFESTDFRMSALLAELQSFDAAVEARQTAQATAIYARIQKVASSDPRFEGAVAESGRRLEELQRTHPATAPPGLAVPPAAPPTPAVQPPSTATGTRYPSEDEPTLLDDQTLRDVIEAAPPPPAPRPVQAAPPPPPPPPPPLQSAPPPLPPPPPVRDPSSRERRPAAAPPPLPPPAAPPAAHTEPASSGGMGDATSIFAAPPRQPASRPAAPPTPPPPPKAAPPPLPPLAQAPKARKIALPAAGHGEAVPEPAGTAPKPPVAPAQPRATSSRPILLVAAVVLLAIAAAAVFFILRKKPAELMPALATAKVQAAQAPLFSEPGASSPAETLVRGEQVNVLKIPRGKSQEWTEVQHVAQGAPQSPGYMRTADLGGWLANEPELAWDLVQMFAPGDSPPEEEAKQYEASIASFLERFGRSPQAGLAHLESARSMIARLRAQGVSSPDAQAIADAARIHLQGAQGNPDLAPRASAMESELAGVVAPPPVEAAKPPVTSVPAAKPPVVVQLDPARVFREVDDHLANSDYDAAERRLRQLLAQRPNDAKAQRLLQATLAARKRDLGR